ncbi:hypothetical protein FZEAL_1445 [Fusarium zealandicum]|uniref:Uncharacterized protein n=1 Tax=Fusarium zealandicum TaxID=1053134 RepID=A0A8H4UT00_9HYPO|nr:hypothetical protein FZEAL_1445 [Fusarium zealandicum]
MKATGGKSFIHLPRVVKLDTADQWIDWYFTLRSQARGLGIWDRINPDNPDEPGDILKAPEFESYHQLKARLIKEAREENEPIPSEESIISWHKLLRGDVEINLAIYHEIAMKEQAILSLIVDTVHPDIYEAAMNKVDIKHGEHSLRQLVRSFQKATAPAHFQITSKIGREYQDILDEARIKTVDPKKWYIRWNKVLTRAEECNVPEVIGTLAISNFLDAVGSCFAPEWAAIEGCQLETAIHKDAEISSLWEYGRYFRLALEVRPFERHRQLDGPQASDKPPASSPCPCGRKRHNWEPENCSILEFAVRGFTDRPIKKLTEEKRDAICSELQKGKWTKLRKKLKREGWEISP